MEELVCELLQVLDPYKSTGPDVIHPSVLRERADIARPLHNLWDVMETGRQPRRLEKANVTCIYNKGLKKDPGN